MAAFWREALLTWLCDRESGWGLSLPFLDRLLRSTLQALTSRSPRCCFD